MKLTSNIKLAIAVLFLLIVYWPLSSGSFTMKFDMMDWFYPMRFLIGECLQNHIFPTWNPFTNLGYPLHLDPQSGALYPPAWIIGYFFGYSLYLINLEFLIHVILAFWGMKKLSEELGLIENIALLLGLSYACCGFFVGNAQHMTWVISATWIPFILCYYLKLIKFNSWKDGFGLSVFCFLLLTGGYPAFSITLFYLLLLAFFVNSVNLLRQKDFKSLKRFVVINSIFTSLFLLQSLCFLVFLKEGLPFIVRGESLSLNDAQLMPFSPQSWISFLLPFAATGDPAFYHTDLSMANGYFGLTGFVFCILSLFHDFRKQKLVLWGFALFFLLVAMGGYTFLHGCLYHNVPMMNLFRYPALFRLFALLCLLILFGFSLQKYWKGTVNNKDWNRLRFLIISILMALSILLIYAFIKGSLHFPEALTSKALASYFSALSMYDSFLIQVPIQIAVLLALFWISWKQKKYFIKFIPFLIAIDLFLSVQLNAFVTVAEAVDLTTLQEKLNKEPKGFPIPVKKISEVTHQGNGEFLPIWYNNNILKKQIAHDGYNNFKLKEYRDFNALPNHMERLNRPLLSWEQADSNADIHIDFFCPNYVTASTSNPKSGEILFLQSDYPGWELILDGEVFPHYKKHGIFIASTIPAGEHTLGFYFQPKNYVLFLYISTITFLSCLMIFLLKADLK